MNSPFSISIEKGAPDFVKMGRFPSGKVWVLVWGYWNDVSEIKTKIKMSVWIA
jgi:hypothetical protein